MTPSSHKEKMCDGSGWIVRNRGGQWPPERDECPGCPACRPEKEKREDAGKCRKEHCFPGCNAVDAEHRENKCHDFSLGHLTDRPKDICKVCKKEKCGKLESCRELYNENLLACHGHPTPRPSQEATEEGGEWEKEQVLHSAIFPHLPPTEWKKIRAKGPNDVTNKLIERIHTLLSRTRKEATEEAWREAGKEQIICAAIRAKNGKLYPCAYHGQGMEQRGYQQKYYGDDGYAEDAQGFITSRNRFVDRVEGLAIAIAAGQVEEDRHGKDKLMSEDLPYNRFEHLIAKARDNGVGV